MGGGLSSTPPLLVSKRRCEELVLWTYVTLIKSKKLGRGSVRMPMMITCTAKIIRFFRRERADTPSVMRVSRADANTSFRSLDRRAVDADVFFRRHFQCFSACDGFRALAMLSALATRSALYPSRTGPCLCPCRVDHRIAPRRFGACERSREVWRVFRTPARINR